jgi:hypothetical protein
MEPEPHVDVAPVEQSVVDAAIYQGGKRTESPATVAQTSRSAACYSSLSGAEAGSRGVALRISVFLIS